MLLCSLSQVLTASPNPTRHPDQHEATTHSPTGQSRRDHQTATSSADENSLETSADSQVHSTKSEERSTGMASCAPVNSLTSEVPATGENDTELRDNYRLVLWPSLHNRGCVEVWYSETCQIVCVGFALL